MKTLDYRVAGTYVTGKSHIKKDKPCQDRIYSKSLNGVTVVSLADGAGSCSKSEIGAEIVTEYVADFICTNFNTLFEKEEKIISKTILEGISKSLSQKAKTLNLSVLDLSSTLLFVGVKDNRYLAGHIGDGLIGYFEGKDVKTLSYPENGEFSNQTYFATKESAINHFRIYKANKNYYLAYYPRGSQESIKKNMLITSDIKKLNNINGFILMSDGSYECLFDKDKKILVEANKTMFSWLENDTNSVAKVEKALKENIKSEFLKKTHDDCSINILTLTKGKIAMEETDLTIDVKQLADNTKKINELQEEFKSIKRNLEDLQKKLSEKVDKNDLKQYDSGLGTLKSKQSEDTKIIKQLKEEIALVKKELANINNKSEEKISNDEITSLIEWKNTIQPILYLLIAGLIGLGVVIIKLLFF